MLKWSGSKLLKPLDLITVSFFGRFHLNLFFYVVNLGNFYS
jgi:hypothetical protein